MTESNKIVPLKVDGVVVGEAEVHNGPNGFEVVAHLDVEKTENETAKAFVQRVMAGILAKEDKILAARVRPCVRPGGTRNVNVCVAEGCSNDWCLEAR